MKPAERSGLGPGSVRSEVAKFGADILGVGVSQLVENGEGLAPGVAGGAGVAHGMLSVTEVGQGVGLAPTPDGEVVVVGAFSVSGELRVPGGGYGPARRGGRSGRA